MLIKVDYREKSIIDLLQTQTQTQEQTQVEVCNLIIGDLVFYNNEGMPFLWIERKTYSDLCASISDGRFREQKTRLLETTGDANKIMYILEGNKEVSGSKRVPKSTINSAIQNLIFKHHFLVMHTSNEQDTVDNILQLAKKFESNEFEKLCNEGPIKIVKKSDKINDNIFINQLQAVPRVSFIIASKISEEYKSMSGLINAYNSLQTEKECSNLLKDIQVSINRKLGPSLSEKIWKSLF